MTSLFNDIIFGPVRSRRLGLSLGVNLLPVESKLCSFDCIYCECGWNGDHPGGRRFNRREDVERLLRETLEKMVAAGTPPDVITFAGNGEPTLHPAPGPPGAPAPTPPPRRPPKSPPPAPATRRSIPNSKPSSGTRCGCATPSAPRPGCRS